MDLSELHQSCLQYYHLKTLILIRLIALRFVDINNYCIILIHECRHQDFEMRHIVLVVITLKRILITHLSRIQINTDYSTAKHMHLQSVLFLSSSQKH